MQELIEGDRTVLKIAAGEELFDVFRSYASRHGVRRHRGGGDRDAEGRHARLLERPGVRAPDPRDSPRAGGAPRIHRRGRWGPVAAPPRRPGRPGPPGRGGPPVARGGRGGGGGVHHHVPWPVLRPPPRRVPGTPDPGPRPGPLTAAIAFRPPAAVPSCPTPSPIPSIGSTPGWSRRCGVAASRS